MLCCSRDDGLIHEAFSIRSGRAMGSSGMLLITILIFILVSESKQQQQQLDDSDKQALLMFLNASGYTVNNLSGSACQWSIIKCSSNSSSNSLQRIQELNLHSRGLQGTLEEIVESLGRLSALKSLDLSANSFVGAIPSGVWYSLPNLQRLDLSSNRFLGGFIPASIATLTQLVSLNLSRNSLNGSVPWDAITRLHYLASLDLSANRLLRGTVPNLGGLRNLETLDLSRNSFTGSIHPSLFRLPGLRRLALRSNILTGPLPVPSQESSLEYLDLRSNSLNGTVPSSIWRIRGLKSLRMSNNLLSGTISTMTMSSIGEQILELDLRNNDLRGEGVVNPRWIHLRLLDLSRNHLAGTLSSEIGKLAMLQSLNLSHNRLQGRIPSSIGALHSLALLDLSWNSFEGAIPVEIASMASLQRVNLSYNALSGEIPAMKSGAAWKLSSISGNSGLSCGRILKNNCTMIRTRRHHHAHHRSIHHTAVVASILMASAVAVFGLLAWMIYYGKNSGKKITRRLTSKQFTTTNSSSSKGEAEINNSSKFVSVSGPFSSEIEPAVWASGIRDPNSVSVVMFEKPLASLSFTDLLNATMGFSKEALIAEGVFAGVLLGDIKVAIKILSPSSPLPSPSSRPASGGKIETTKAHLEALGQLKHRNLVPLLGFCLIGPETLLIYAYMPGGDLHSRLHELPEGTPNPDDFSGDTWDDHCDDDPDDGGGGGSGGGGGHRLASWRIRHRIALGAARALAFLHHGCNPRIVHGRIDSRNVLLDAGLEPRIADVGLSGPLSPSAVEYSEKDDTFAYGVVLLELLTGRDPENMPADNGSNLNGLVAWVRSLVREKRGLKALDPRMVARHGPAVIDEMLEALRVAYLCTAELPSKRPTMHQVVGLLKDIRSSTMMTTMSSPL